MAMTKTTNMRSIVSKARIMREAKLHLIEIDLGDMGFAESVNAIQPSDHHFQAHGSGADIDDGNDLEWTLIKPKDSDNGSVVLSPGTGDFGKGAVNFVTEDFGMTHRFKRLF